MLELLELVEPLRLEPELLLVEPLLVEPLRLVPVLLLEEGLLLLPVLPDALLEEVVLELERVEVVRLEVDSSPLSLTVLIRVLEEPEVLTRLLTVVCAGLDEELLLLVPVLLPVAVPLLLPVLPVELLVVPEEGLLSVLELALVPVPEVVVEVDLEGVALTALLLDVLPDALLVDLFVEVVVVTFAASFISRTSRAFTTGLEVCAAPLVERLWVRRVAVRELNDCSGCFTS